jgi:hypothetical protein
LVGETSSGTLVSWRLSTTLAAFSATISSERSPRGAQLKIAARQSLRAIFRDYSYDNDAVKINVEQIFKALSPATEAKGI